MSDIRVTPSSGNIFADIGLPNPEEHLAKAQIVAVVDAFIKRQHLTQAAAAKRMGIAQPDVSKLLKGRYDGFSLDRLIGLLLILGHDVALEIRPPANGDSHPGRLTLACA